MFRHQALITCKRQLKSLTQLSFSLMGESGAKVDDEENGLADHQYSRKLFLKTRPLRGLLSFPPRCRSPPSSMSSTKLSLKAPPQIQMIIHCHVGVRRATLRPPPWRRWGHPANLQSSSFLILVPRSMGTSTLVKADVDDDPSPSQLLSVGHRASWRPLHRLLLFQPRYSPTPLTGLIMIFVPCLNSSLEFILVSGFRWEILTPSLAFLLCGLTNIPVLFMLKCSKIVISILPPCFSLICFHKGLSAAFLSASATCSSPLQNRFFPDSPAYFEHTIV